MKKFHTGDRVRVISERNMEGIVTGRDKHGNVLVEMTDGFEQAFPDRELALVHSSAEAAAFTSASSPVTRAQAGPTKAAEARGASGPAQAAPAAPPSRKGIFLGLSAPIVGSNARELVLLNNADLSLALTVGYNREGRYQTDKILLAGPKQATLLLEVPYRHLQDKPTFQVWAYAAAPGQTTHPIALHTAWHLPADFAERPLEPAPVTGKPMLYIELEGPGLGAPPEIAPRVIGALPGGKLVQMAEKKEPAAPALSGKAIAEAMMAPKAPTPAPPPPPPPSDTLDLHIEQLTSRAAQLSSDEILQTQLRAFEQAFEQALSVGQPTLTLVHGVSSPALRLAIHRRLSAAAQNGLIAHFEDVQKERLGYGATRVTFQ